MSCEYRGWLINGYSICFPSSHIQRSEFLIMVIVLQLNNSNGKNIITFQKFFVKKLVLVVYLRSLFLRSFHLRNTHHITDTLFMNTIRMKKKKKRLFVDMLEFLFLCSWWVFGKKIVNVLWYTWSDMNVWNIVHFLQSFVSYECPLQWRKPKLRISSNSSTPILMSFGRCNILKVYYKKCNNFSFWKYTDFTHTSTETWD